MTYPVKLTRRPMGDRLEGFGFDLDEVRRWATEDLDLDAALYSLGRWTIVKDRHPGWDDNDEDHRNRILLNNILAALGLETRIERHAT